MSDFQGRPIVKRTINLGIAGQIELGENHLPLQSLVSFTARARVSSIKYKLLEKEAAVEEITVLTVDPETFEIQGIQPAPEQQQLPLTNQGTVTVEETDRVDEDMGLQGPLAVPCVMCGHKKGDHAEGELAHGECLVSWCGCDGFMEPEPAPSEAEEVASP